jgi:hypothetical protein
MKFNRFIVHYVSRDDNDEPEREREKHQKKNLSSLTTLSYNANEMHCAEESEE